MRAFFLAWLGFLTLTLQALEPVLKDQVRLELDCIAMPRHSWRPVDENWLDVAIIGAGQSGLGLCFALRAEGIFHTAVFDEAPMGLEGPWVTSAKMLSLRSPKYLSGPCLGVPSLAFRSWYEACFPGTWQSLERLTPQLWSNYLSWYRQVLELPVFNHYHLVDLQPQEGGFRLLFEGGEQVLARKVVLATGRGGLGGRRLPSFVHALPKSVYFHSGEAYDPSVLASRRVLVVGGAASAFDCAASALEAQARSVTLLMRRPEIQLVNAALKVPYWPGFYKLSDQERVDFFNYLDQEGPMPPKHSVERATSWSSFELLKQVSIDKASYQEGQIILETSAGRFEGDYLLLGTGYEVDLKNVSYLQAFADQILLWSDRPLEIEERLGRFPYLGEHFQFLEKQKGSASYLRHLYCFNDAAFLSHGRVAGDIDLINVGLWRLAKGLASDLFADEGIVIDGRRLTNP